MSQLWPTPRPRNLTLLSPTMLNLLLKCGLRAAFELDDSFRHWRRLTPRSALGIVAHRLMADAYSGRFADQDQQRRAALLEDRWDVLIHKQAAMMRAAWAPAEPPEPRNWPGYALIKVRVIRQLTGEHDPQRTSASAGLEGISGAGAAMPSLPLVEHRMEDSATGIYGTPDRVERIAGRLRVVDLKSGLHQQGVTDEQRRQLLLYAHLVEVTLGQVPDDLVITDIRGHETYLPFDTSDSAEAVRVAQQTREAWNSAISSSARPILWPCRVRAPAAGAPSGSPAGPRGRPRKSSGSCLQLSQVSSATSAGPIMKCGSYRNSLRQWPTKTSASSASQSPTSPPETISW